MCEISVLNLHDRLLNEKLWLLLGTIGSPKNPDGWGVANQSGDYFKCAVPMHWTTNSGGKIREVAPDDDSPMLGHIRNASPQVPVEGRNAHPFKLEDIVFVHNGKLTPRDEKNFILEEEVKDIDAQTKKQKTDPKGNLLTKKVKRSDSLIFFEEFVKDWSAAGDDFDTQDGKFVNILSITMSKFYGPFAMVFIINGAFYIVRGKKTLHISYLKNSKGKTTGWVVNTSKETLDTACLLLGNLQGIEGKDELFFSFPTLLTEETVFIAEDLDLKKIGEIKEGIAPVVTTPYKKWEGDRAAAGEANFTKTGEIDKLEKITRLIVAFMEDYSLSPQDIMNLLYMSFGYSSLEVTESILEVFYEKVLIRLANRTDKKIRKALRKSAAGFVGLYDYRDLSYPWMMNNKGNQRKFIK